ncbi:unnamed protein product [Rangifer tarandus platyrhynchus]|uniref:Olfactory receptor n=1 Tax=Rangifer tarandus platyrhynchus TaxID=3082113 RepID=A0ABN8YH79_RANTA|nr:unnamed protein product [Rangifer tarandus platyrhynchus]
MGQGNKTQTWMSEFILLGLSSDWGTQVSLFVLFLAMYLVTIVGNVLILLLIRLDSRLHTPMYFFLSVLSLVDLCYSSSIVPQMLVHLLSVQKSIPISFAHCMIQLYFFIALMCTECVLLAAMAYDRYVAICCPLHYPTIMSHGLCFRLALGSWTIGFGISLAKTYFISRLSFCGPNVINHFFCDISPVLNLSCTDMLNQAVIFAASMLVLVGPLGLVLLSYARILAAILRTRSGEGRGKAFSTCSSHLCVVGLFFGSAIVMYMAPTSRHPEKQQKILSLFYSLFHPMLNPLIYSLRNAEIKGALRRVLWKDRLM